jgi:hypothetical protein
LESVDPASLRSGTHRLSLQARTGGARRRRSQSVEPAWASSTEFDLNLSATAVGGFPQRWHSHWNSRDGRSPSNSS